MDIFSQYAVDPKLEQEGKDFDWGEGLTLILARSHNPIYTKMINTRFEAHKHTLELKDTPEQLKAAEDRSHKIMAEVLAHTVLIGWKGEMIYKGQPLEYSVANAEMLLLHKDFQREVARKADDFRNFRFQTEEADVKNSEPTSSGTSLGANTLIGSNSNSATMA